MDKFGIFDIFTKLAQDKNVQNLLSSTINTLISKPSLENKNNAPTKQSDQTIKRNKYSEEAILKLLKRHDEISKNIDKNLEKPPKK